MGVTIRILGLDPGLSAMGWGVIDVAGSRLTHVAHGVIATKPSIGLGARLMALHRELAAVIALHMPASIAVEQAFVARDPQAARRAMRDHLARVIEGLLHATETDALERARAEVEEKRSDLARRVAI